MGLKKETATAEAPAAEPQKESGVDAAVDRLTQPKQETQTRPASRKYADRDFDAEARGKTLCALYCSVYESPAAAGMRWDKIEDFFAIADKMVAHAMKRIFPND